MKQHSSDVSLSGVTLSDLHTHINQRPIGRYVPGKSTITDQEIRIEVSINGTTIESSIFREIHRPHMVKITSKEQYKNDPGWLSFPDIITIFQGINWVSAGLIIIIFIATLFLGIISDFVVMIYFLAPFMIPPLIIYLVLLGINRIGQMSSRDSLLQTHQDIISAIEEYKISLGDVAPQKCWNCFAERENQDKICHACGEQQ